MEGNRYRWLWWILGVLIVAGLIWYGVARSRTEEYTDGTLVWNPSEVLCMTAQESEYNLQIVNQPSVYEGGMEAWQKPFI